MKQAKSKKKTLVRYPSLVDADLIEEVNNVREDKGLKWRQLTEGWMRDFLRKNRQVR